MLTKVWNLPVLNTSVFLASSSALERAAKHLIAHWCRIRTEDKVLQIKNLFRYFGARKSENKRIQKSVKENTATIRDTQGTNGKEDERGPTQAKGRRAREG